MNEAMGELNGSVIVLSAVALLSAVFFMVVWPMVKEGLKEDARCADAVCYEGYNDNGMADCYNPNSSKKDTYECPYRG